MEQTMTTLTKRYLTPDEVAAKLGVDRQRVYWFIRYGRLKAYKFGGRIMSIDTADLEEFINGSMVPKKQQLKLPQQG